jgi:hypothetical protein
VAKEGGWRLASPSERATGPGRCDEAANLAPEKKTKKFELEKLEQIRKSLFVVSYLGFS